MSKVDRILSLVLAVVMLVCLFPATAQAVGETPSITIGTVTLYGGQSLLTKTEKILDGPPPENENEYVWFDTSDETAKLVLKDAKITSSEVSGIGITYNDNLNIELLGDNVISGSTTQSLADGIYIFRTVGSATTPATVTFHGDGNLTVKGNAGDLEGQYVNAITVGGEIIFNGTGTITAIGGKGTESYGINNTLGSVTINSGTVIAEGNTQAIMLVKDDCKVTRHDGSALIADELAEKSLRIEPPSVPTPDPVLTGLSITHAPTNTVYHPGDTLNLDGLLVTLTYDKGDPKYVTPLYLDKYGISVSPETLTLDTTAVTLAYGDITASFPITVWGITKEPQSLTLEQGQSGTLSVTAEASRGTLTYQWYTRDADRDNLISGANAATLTLTGLELGIKSYFCRVGMTGAEPVDSDVVTVTVTPRPVTLLSITAPAPLTFPNGTSLLMLPATVAIVTSEGSSTAAVTWDKPVYDPSLSTAQSFVVHGTVTLDGVTNPDNISLTTSIDVTVSARPVITIAAQPESLRIFRGGSASVSVTAAASEGTLSYQWYMRNEQGVDNLIDGATEASYELPAETTAATGLYRLFCRVSIAGTGWYADSDAAALTVYPASGEITGLAITGMPRNYYSEDEPLDLSGLLVRLTYSDGSTLDLTADDLAFFGLTSSFAAGEELPHGFQKLTVSVGGFSDAVPLTVVKPLEKVEEIPVLRLDLPFGTTLAGLLEKLPDMVEVVTDYGPENCPVIWDTDSITYDPSLTTEQTFLIHGTVTLPYFLRTRSALTLPVTISVIVAAKPPPVLIAISALALPKDDAFVQGTEPDLTGLRLSLVYDDAASREVDIATLEELRALGITTAQELSELKPGTHKLTFTGGSTVFMLTLQVTKPVVTKLEIVDFPTKRVYFEEEPLNLTGLHVNIHYDSGKIVYAVVPRFEELGITVEPAANGPVALEDTEVVLTCGGASVSFVIEVGRRRADYYYPGDPDRNLSRTRSSTRRARNAAEQALYDGFLLYDAGEVRDDTLLLLLSSIPGYRDVRAGDWFFMDVTWAWVRGISEDSVTFCPNEDASRAVIAQWLWHLEGSPAAASAPFTDTSAASAAWASEAGVVNGYGGGRFGPNDAVTREQFAAMLFRYVRWCGAEASARGELGRFVDAGAISSWAREAMAWAVGTGIMGGRPDGSLDPRGYVTRAEAAAMLHRCAVWYGL